MTVAPPAARDRLAGRYVAQRPGCRTHRRIGPACGGAGPVPARARRKTERRAVRRYVDDVLGTEPRNPLVDHSDCRHGCNGMCLVAGSDRCTFTCHQELRPDDPWLRDVERRLRERESAAGRAPAVHPWQRPYNPAMDTPEAAPAVLVSTVTDDASIPLQSLADTGGPSTAVDRVLALESGGLLTVASFQSSI